MASVNKTQKELEARGWLFLKFYRGDYSATNFRMSGTVGFKNKTKSELVKQVKRYQKKYDKGTIKAN